MKDPCHDFQLSPAELADGWRILSGTSAPSQWRAGPEQPLPVQGWRIRGTCLELMEPGIAPSLHATHSYRDFDLKWEWEIERGGNSGIKYLAEIGFVPPHLKVIPDYIGLAAGAFAVVGFLLLWLTHRRFRRATAAAGLAALALSALGFWQRIEVRERISHKYRGNAVGFEYQMLDDRNNPEGASAKLRTGAVYDLLPVVRPPIPTTREVSLEHASRILVKDGRVQHWLDGELVVEYALGSAELEAALRQSKFNQVSHLFRRESGLLYLQNHSSRVTFRNIRLRDLSTSSD